MLLQFILEPSNILVEHFIGTLEYRHLRDQAADILFDNFFSALCHVYTVIVASV
jgi:hypothetical protein